MAEVKFNIAQKKIGTLDDLGSDVRWIGDNIGMGDSEEIITIADKTGCHAYSTFDELRSHPAWMRLDEYSRKRITMD